jgi:hypothetical protein
MSTTSPFLVLFEFLERRGLGGSSRGFRSILGPGCFMALFLVLTGCGEGIKSSPGSSLGLAGLQYDICFEEVIQIASDSGMPAIVRDRAGGLVETSPRLCGSVFEPWRQDNADFGETIENTIALQRRRARFEFVPANFVPPPLSDPSVLDGSPLPGSTNDTLFDLRSYEGVLELRVWVYIERAFTPGLRNGTWSRSQLSFSSDPLAPERLKLESGATVDLSRWTPLRRDTAYEQRLVEVIRTRFSKLSAGEPDPESVKPS